MDVIEQTEVQDYYAEAYVRVRATSEAEAVAMIGFVALGDDLKEITREQFEAGLRSISGGMET
jgi:hypothetical protein